MVTKIRIQIMKWQIQLLRLKTQDGRFKRVSRSYSVLDEHKQN